MQGAANTEELVRILDGIEGRRYAVVDAAHFDNLQELLNEAQLPFHPLYLDEKDPAPGAEIAGPHLVELPTRGSARKLIALADGKPAIVWWVWPESGKATTDEIYRHLRRLNVIEIPAQLDKPPDTPHDAGADHSGHEHGHDSAPVQQRYDLVIFRHGDPGVLEHILPLLDSRQVSRLFGRASVIVLASGESVAMTSAPVAGSDGTGFIAFSRPTNLPPLSRGRLRIFPEQFERMGAARIAMFKVRIAGYLRKVAPQQTARMSEGMLERHVEACMHESQDYGVTSEGSHARWAYLQLLAGGNLSRVKEVDVLMRMENSDHHPNLRMRILMENMVRHLQAIA